MPTYDKLTIVNNALICSGNEPVTGDDGSPQWTVASTAYDRALPLVMEKGGWTFQSGTANLVRVGASAYPGYTDIYAKPVDCLHIENVWRTDLAAYVFPRSGFDESGQGAMPPKLDYKIIGNQIHAYAPNGLTCLYIQIPEPYGQSGTWPPGFAEAVTRQVEVYLLAGLNEDLDAAKLAQTLLNTEIQEARYRSDAEGPRRVGYRSRFMERRRTPKTGLGW